MSIDSLEIFKSLIGKEERPFLDIIESASKRLEEFDFFKREGLICMDGDFFPSVHYPPITMYPPIKEEELFDTYTLPEDGMFDLYVHFPFCINFCNFCHYPNRIGELTEEKENYISHLEKEMDLYMAKLGLNKIKARSILIGGGTPTYLIPKHLERFLSFFTSKVDLSSCTQFNYDVDPSTLLGNEGRERLRILKRYGVNRLTIGMQSMDDAILRKMNRAHDARQAIESVRNSKEYGFQVNIEFIYGYPGQSIFSWIDTIRKAVTLNVEEIQIYRLKFIPYGDHKGLISKKIQGDYRTSLAYTAILMKEIANILFVKNGWSENLRRVFTRSPEHYSHYAHNQCCNLYDQIGFGLTAFSSLRDRFGLNTKSFKGYFRSIERGRLPLNRGIVRSIEDQARWAIILPLKNRSVRKRRFQKVTGLSLDFLFREKIEKLKRYGLVKEDERSLGLTPLGVFFADEVAQQFYHPKYMPFPEDHYSKGPLNPFNDNKFNL